MYLKRDDMQDLVIIKKQNKETVRKKNTDNTKEHSSESQLLSSASYTEMSSFNWT